MIRLNGIWLAAVLAYVFFSSRLPSERQCRAIVLRAADGRELTVRSDGSGRYGFGTGMMFKEVRKGTFDFSSLYDQAKRMLAKPLRKAEEPYIALSFWKTGQTAAVEYPVRMDEELLRRIFSLARQNALPWPPDEAMDCAGGRGVWRKVKIDAAQVDADGLRGPPDGKVAVSYEFAIPNTSAYRDKVRTIDQTVRFMLRSQGRSGVTGQQCLCIGSTRQKDWRQVLCALAGLPFVERIIECHFE